MQKTLFLMSLLLISNSAYAQGTGALAAGTNMVVKQPSIIMTRAPKGGKMGEVYINSPLTVEKEDGDWALVSIKAWVKKEGLGAAAAAQPAKTTVSQASTELVIDSFSTKLVQEGLPEKRVYLTLKLKNNTAQPIEKWRALLVAQANDAVAFREQISDDTKVIPPGQSVELNFYWEPNEQPYEYLVDATPQTIKLELYQYGKDE